MAAEDGSNGAWHDEIEGYFPFLNITPLLCESVNKRLGGSAIMKVHGVQC